LSDFKYGYNDNLVYITLDNSRLIITSDHNNKRNRKERKQTNEGIEVNKKRQMRQDGWNTHEMKRKNELKRQFMCVNKCVLLDFNDDNKKKKRRKKERKVFVCFVFFFFN